MALFFILILPFIICGKMCDLIHIQTLKSIEIAAQELATFINYNSNNFLRFEPTELTTTDLNVSLAVPMNCKSLESFLKELMDGSKGNFNLSYTVVIDFKIREVSIEKKPSE